MKIFSIVMLILLSLVVLGIALYTMIGFACYKLSLARKSTAKKISKAGRKADKDSEKSLWWDSHPTERVTTKSEEGLTLVGHFLKNQSDKVVILLHGFGSDWTQWEIMQKSFISATLMFWQCLLVLMAKARVIWSAWVGLTDLTF